MLSVLYETLFIIMPFSLFLYLYFFFVSLYVLSLISLFFVNLLILSRCLVRKLDVTNGFTNA